MENQSLSSLLRGFSQPGGDADRHPEDLFLGADSCRGSASPIYMHEWAHGSGFCDSSRSRISDLQLYAMLVISTKVSWISYPSKDLFHIRQ